MRKFKQLQSHNTSEYDLIYSKVKRGEVYLCDFGESYGSEQGFMRYAIIVQNDDGNFHSPTTIVIACTSEPKKDFQFIFIALFLLAIWLIMTWKK